MISKNLTNFLNLVYSESFCTTGYNPLLNFEIADLALTIEKLKNYGAKLDGDIVDEDDKKVKYEGMGNTF